MPLLMLAFMGVTVGLAGPAYADPCSPWSSETAMRNAPTSCRGTWLVEPGIGNLIGRDQLMDADTLDNHHGFSEQWRWYAPTDTITVTDPDQEWAYCLDGSPFDEFCPPDDVRTSNNGILNSFGPSQITLHTYSFHGKHIAQVCGNFFLTPGTHDDPVPRLRIEKYDDRNRNGVRDAGESGLSGWQFRIVRSSSRFGDQGLGTVDTVTTGGDGAVEFRFDGDGPGLYRIEEIARDGWAPTTPTAQSIVVDPGIGEAHLGTLRFGNAETRADLVKVDFGLVDPPERLEAGQTTELTVRAQLRNGDRRLPSSSDMRRSVIPPDDVHRFTSASIRQAWRIRIRPTTPCPSTTSLRSSIKQISI